MSSLALQTATKPIPEVRIGSLYIRVSTHEQDELSPDAQIRLGLEYAKSNNILVPKEYIFFESVSGRKAKNRHEFQRMISIAKSPEHPIDVILVWKFSRFARNQEESIVYKSMLKKDGVEVISISEPLVDGPFGSLIERIIEWMDEYYSIRLSGEVQRGMKEKALRNGYQLSPPLGYKAVGGGSPYVIDEDEFKIVDYIFRQFDDHNMDPTRIARNLNEMGYRTRRGGLFELRSIDRILKNPFYYGLVTWNDISFMGPHEVRYTKEQYDQRMEKFRKRYSKPRRRNVSSCKHWLSGLIKCGYCGTVLTFNNSQKAFQCWRYAKGFHKESMQISERKILAAVYEYFEHILAGGEFQYTYRAPETIELSTERNALLDELEKITAREARIALAFEKGVDTLEEYAENKKRLKKARNDLEAEIAKLDERPAATGPSKSEILDTVRTVYDIIKNPDVDMEM
ncbi:MAG: recombinase family protein, partial [Agathobacter sp.]